MVNINFTILNRYQRLELIDKFRLAKRFYIEKNHDINNTVLLEGTSRSGTTWLAEMLSKYFHYRLIFEPFYPQKVELFKNFIYKQYIPPDFKNELYYRIFKEILSGRIKNKWIDNDNQILRPKGRIIKSIRASLFLKWMKTNFPELPIIYIMRHPCAVVSSRIQWKTSELELMVKQKQLVKDHLAPFLEIILKAKTLAQRNACIWCIQNYIALETMADEDWIIITYEDLIANLNGEIKKIVKYINPDAEFNVARIKNKISKVATKESAVVKKENKLNVWQKRLSEDDINDILELVEHFSLDSIYDKNLMPKRKFR